jgi:hypothetical protein
VAEDNVLEDQRLASAERSSKQVQDEIQHPGRLAGRELQVQLRQPDVVNGRDRQQKRHTPEQIITKLRGVDLPVALG